MLYTKFRSNVTFVHLQDADTLVPHSDLFCIAMQGPVTTGDKTALEEKITNGWRGWGSAYSGMEANLRLQELFLDIQTG